MEKLIEEANNSVVSDFMALDQYMLDKHITESEIRKRILPGGGLTLYAKITEGYVIKSYYSHIISKKNWSVELVENLSKILLNDKSREILGDELQVKLVTFISDKDCKELNICHDEKGRLFEFSEKNIVDLFMFSNSIINKFEIISKKASFKYPIFVPIPNDSVNFDRNSNPKDAELIEHFEPSQSVYALYDGNGTINLNLLSFTENYVIELSKLNYVTAEDVFVKTESFNDSSAGHKQPIVPSKNVPNQEISAKEIFQKECSRQAKKKRGVRYNEAIQNFIDYFIKENNFDEQAIKINIINAIKQRIGIEIPQIFEGNSYIFCVEVFQSGKESRLSVKQLPNNDFYQGVTCDDFDANNPKKGEISFKSLPPYLTRSLSDKSTVST